MLADWLSSSTKRETMSGLLAKKGLSEVLEGVNSQNFSLAQLACSKPPLLSLNDTLNFQLIAFIYFCTDIKEGGVAFAHTLGASIFCTVA